MITRWKKRQEALKLHRKKRCVLYEQWQRDEHDTHLIEILGRLDIYMFSACSVTGYKFSINQLLILVTHNYIINHGYLCL